MSGKQPVIKFSPFEALLIGEKNKILKRQPMKNTIFVTRLNQQRKDINLRDLFGLERDPKNDNKNDGIFKMPQRVRDFLKNRKLQNSIGNSTCNNKKEVLFYEFEGQKINARNTEVLKPKEKNSKLKSNRVKFKKKFKYMDSLKGRVVRKFPNHPKRNYYYYYYKSRCKNSLPRLASKKTKRKYYRGKRHALRGKDGKFIPKGDHKKLESKEISPRQKYKSNFLHQLYLKKNKRCRGNENHKLKESQMSYTVGSVLSPTEKAFDITSLESILDEEFHFPQFPKQTEISEYEDDNNLQDIIYEGFPKSIKFECKSVCDDFSDALLDSEIVKPEKNLKIYEKKKNGVVKDEGVTVILNSHIPCFKLRALNNIRYNHCPGRNGYSSKIDEPHTRQSHLISARSLGSFFFRSAEGKDVFIGSLVKPFLQNSWFGSLSEF